MNSRARQITSQRSHGVASVPGGKGSALITLADTNSVQIQLQPCQLTST